MVSSVGHNMPISRTSFRLREMYSWFEVSKLVDLRLFLHVGADHARAGEVFLRPRRNLGEHGLNAFEALVNPPSEVLDHDADNRQRQKGIQRQLGD